MTTAEQRMTGQRLKRTARDRVAQNLFTTIPIVLAGSMAVGFGLTGPITSSVPKAADKPKTAPSLAKSLRVALAAASRTVQPAAPVSVSATAVAAAPTTYVVAAGDTVSSIAGHYGLATASVLALNGLGWKSMIFPGQHLKLTASGAVPAASAPAAAVGVTRYTILSGDTMGSLAAKFGIPTATLLSANGLGWSSIIYPGQSIVVPSLGSAAPVKAAPVAAVAPVSSVTPIASGSSYIVKTGDTISGIAAKSGVSVQALLSANGLVMSSLIFSGRSLKIPAGGSSSAPASTGSDLSLVSSTSSVLTAEMTTNARTIIGVGRSLGVPDYGIVIALAAALQESGLRNLHYGDRDSLGLFQQRPSTGWGTQAQVLDTTYASRLFFGGPSNPNAGKTNGLLDISGWKSMTVTVAAQAVQRSGYPTAYAKWEPTARAALAKLG
jgi:LysM repeat protein